MSGWPSRPSPRWPGVDSESEYLCHVCKNYKNAWKYPTFNMETGQNSVYAIRGMEREGKRWACTDCFLDVARSNGLFVSCNDKNR